MGQFLLPDFGEGLEEAEIVAWHATEGDHVVVDQPLVSVETDKAVVEVPSPQSGCVARLFGSKGGLVKVGAPLVEFSEGAEIDTGTVVGELHADGPKSVVDLPIGDHGPAALAPRLDHLHPYNARAPRSILLRWQRCSAPKGTHRPCSRAHG